MVQWLRRPKRDLAHYSAAEMRKFVGWALKQPDGWEKWITLLLAYTGARRGEIAKLEKSQIKYDEDSQRHYLLIAEGGRGKPKMQRDKLRSTPN